MGKAIILQFTDFDLEPTPSRTCDYDFVEIYDGIKSNSTLVGRYCGEQIPETLVSSSNFIHLIFISDISMGGRGFLANYSFIESSKTIHIKFLFKFNNQYKKIYRMWRRTS